MGTPSPRVASAAAVVVLALAAAVAVLLVRDDEDRGATSPLGPDPEALVAEFEWDYDPTQTAGTACSFGTTYFHDRSSGGPTSWLWEFPDGSTSTEQDPVVESSRTMFVRADGSITRDVSLTVSRDGQTDTVTVDVYATHC